MRSVSAVQERFAPVSVEDAALLASAHLELIGARRAGVQLVGSSVGMREMTATVAGVLGGSLPLVEPVADLVVVSFDDEAVAA
ncbi:hypothetical protein [Amycolatopsis sp. NPDC058986]|uniref:hypothetical protein n=1 Tax=unclassified Amycolatopsis TaxID=2618356 RepID=UPI003670D47E